MEGRSRHLHKSLLRGLTRDSEQHCIWPIGHRVPCAPGTQDCPVVQKEAPSDLIGAWRVSHFSKVALRTRSHIGFTDGERKAGVGFGEKTFF